MNRDDFTQKYGWDGKEKVCEGALRFIDSFSPDATADDIWKVLNRADWALWLLKRLVDENDKRFRAMACDFIWRTPVNEREYVYDILPKLNSKIIIGASFACSRSQISEDELNGIISIRPSPAERLADKAARVTAIFPAVYAAISSAEKCRLCAADIAREEDPEVIELEKKLKEAHDEQYMAGSLLAHDFGKTGQEEAAKTVNESRITALGIVSQLERARMVAERKAIETASALQCDIIREYFPSVEGI